MKAIVSPDLTGEGMRFPEVTVQFDELLPVVHWDGPRNKRSVLGTLPGPVQAALQSLYEQNWIASVNSAGDKLRIALPVGWSSAPAYPWIKAIVAALSAAGIETELATQ